MDVGSSIRQLRQQCGLTQEELAKTLYVSRQTISSWESNRSTPDAQSLVMMSALFGVSVDSLVRDGLETVALTTHQERRRTGLSLARSAAIGALGCVLIAPALVSEAGPLAGGALSLVPLATALIVATLSHAASRENVPLSVLRTALESNVTLRMRVSGSPRELSAQVLGSGGAPLYVIEHTARVVRGERWAIRGSDGRCVARVAYRLITAGIQTPSIEAKIDGLGNVRLSKEPRMGGRHRGIALVWELTGCDVTVSGNWLGEHVALERSGERVAELRFSGEKDDEEEASLRVARGRDVDLVVTLTFLLAIVRAEERRV